MELKKILITYLMQNTSQFCAQGVLYKQRPFDHPSITGKKD